MLSPEQVQRYHADGYVTPEFQIPEDVLTDISARVDGLLARHPEFRDNCSALLRDTCAVPSSVTVESPTSIWRSSGVASSLAWDALPGSIGIGSPGGLPCGRNRRASMAIAPVGRFRRTGPVCRRAQWPYGGTCQRRGAGT